MPPLIAGDYLAADEKREAVAEIFCVGARKIDTYKRTPLSLIKKFYIGKGEKMQKGA